MKDTMKVQAVVPAAGIGERFGPDTAKPFALLKGIPLIVYALKKLQESPEIPSIVIAGRKDRISDLEALCREHHLTKVSQIVAGGRTRRESVSKALDVLDKDTDCVLIHDAARPLLTGKMIREGIELCGKHKAVIVAVPVIPTIKYVDSGLTVVETPDRGRLWEAQTPQIFDKALIISAHKEVEDLQASDDAVLVERLGHAVKVLEGDYRNIKVTTPDDLKVAETFLETQEG